jgi:hypothetical protein
VELGSAANSVLSVRLLRVLPHRLPVSHLFSSTSFCIESYNNNVNVTTSALDCGYKLTGEAIFLARPRLALAGVGVTISEPSS